MRRASAASGPAKLAQPPSLQLIPAGDTAVVVVLGRIMDRQLSRAVLALADRILAASVPGVVEVVPAFASLTVHFDPRLATLGDLSDAIARLAALPGETASPPRQWTIPVCYEGGFAQDLAEVSERSGLAQADVIARHTAADFHVYMLGFLPGFPYMGDLEAALRLPRRPSPRVAVPAGSVAIAEAMTAIYPQESPGGWHIVGRTPVRLFDPAAVPPARLRAGDQVRFRPVTRGEYEHLAEGEARGESALVPDPSPERREGDR